MSFRRNRNNIKYILYTGGNVKPKKGCVSVYYWIKGSDAGEEWVKADVYGVDGEIKEEEMLAASLEHLKKLIEK